MSELLQQICLKSILINQDTLMKRHLPPLAPLLKGQRGKCPPHASILSRPCAYHSTHTLFTRCCRLQCVTVIGINYSQRSPKTQQFMTAKISCNALKQRSRTHSALRQRSSQLQTYKAARMSCGIAVDQKVCDGDVGHPGWAV